MTCQPSLAGLALALIAVGVFITVNLNRQLRLASSRVSFVNQVSHELRTPLTNIRMYADLLAQQLDDNPEQAQAAARAKGAERYEAFVDALGRRLAKGPTLLREVSLDMPTSSETDGSIVSTEDKREP